MGVQSHPVGALPARLITLKVGKFISIGEVTNTDIGR